jgi:hypothetical protein
MAAAFGGGLVSDMAAAFFRAMPCFNLSQVYCEAVDRLDAHFSSACVCVCLYMCVCVCVCVCVSLCHVFNFQKETVVNSKTTELRDSLP